MTIKETPLTLAMKHRAEVCIKGLEGWRQRWVDPMFDVGTPERVLGKPYAEWTEEDMALLGQVFGLDLDRYLLSREIRAAKGQ